jgi:hypothetical protein
MLRMLKTSMFVVAIAMATGCGGDKIEKGLKDFKDRMCACKDLACADKVHEEYKKWENDVLEPAFKGKKEEDISKSLIALDKERKDCRRKLRDAAEPAGGGDAPPAPTP